MFVEQNHDQWESSRTVQWMYAACKQAANMTDAKDGGSLSLSLALGRYSATNMSNYNTTVQMLPEEVNILDPTLMQYALTIDPNRGPLMRRMMVGNGRANARNDPDAGIPGLARNGLIDLTNAPTDHIDPDSPLLEIFLRSALPWSQVEGVRPQHR